MKKQITYSYFALLFLLLACEAEVDEKIDIGSPPTASFEISQGSDTNTFVLTNTTEGGFITQWETDGNGTLDGQVAEAYFPFAGNYTITMTTFNAGGSASAQKELTVAEDDPNACFGVFQTLTGCTEKIWKLAPEPNALNVGPSLQETWWGNSEQDVIDRECHFNDEYIFRANGEFEYKNNGDFWADSDANGNIFPPALGLSVGCHPDSAWPEAFQAWNSGLHTFTNSSTSLTVVGQGAWIGLYKIGTASEVDAPQSSVKFDIAEISEDRIVIFSDNGGGVWRITLVAQ